MNSFGGYRIGLSVYCQRKYRKRGSVLGGQKLQNRLTKEERLEQGFQLITLAKGTLFFGKNSMIAAFHGQ